MAKTPGMAATALFAWALWAGQPAMGQDPVDGVCDESVRNGCSAGTPTPPRIPTNRWCTTGAATASVAAAVIQFPGTFAAETE